MTSSAPRSSVPRQIEILTIFPEIFSGFLVSSLIKKAIDKKKLCVELTNIRDFADPPHFKVDDEPYGGGAGMVMKPEPIARAIKEAKSRVPEALVVYMSPSGQQLTQSRAKELSNSDLIILCGRYEGVDQRVLDMYVDLEISIGDYVLMGGEVPAMALIEASARLVPDIIGNADSLETESFSHKDRKKTLEFPHYTRPAEFEGLEVPEVLCSGDHRRIEEWRSTESEKRTRKIRPELIKD